MKLTAVFIFVLLCNYSNAQSWGLSRVDTTAFAIKDTLKSYSGVSVWDTSLWAEITPDASWSKPSFYKRKYEQFRYNRSTGRRQRRVATVEFILTPKSKSDYEKIIDSVSK